MRAGHGSRPGVGRDLERTFNGGVNGVGVRAAGAIGIHLTAARSSHPQYRHECEKQEYFHVTVLTNPG
jgi:hypothetical protein